MKMNTSEERDRAWQMVKLMEMVSVVVAVLLAFYTHVRQDYSDKMVVSLLKVELLLTAETFDISEFYNGRFIVSSCHPAIDVASTSSDDSDYCSQ
jgi:hypothetical protein